MQKVQFRNLRSVNSVFYFCYPWPLCLAPLPLIQIKSPHIFVFLSTVDIFPRSFHCALWNWNFICKVIVRQYDSKNTLHPSPCFWPYLKWFLEDTASVIDFLRGNCPFLQLPCVKHHEVALSFYLKFPFFIDTCHLSSCPVSFLVTVILPVTPVLSHGVLTFDSLLYSLPQSFH